MLGLGLGLRLGHMPSAAGSGGGGGATPATLNPADQSTMTLTNGNLISTTAGSSAQSSIRATRAASASKVYWEVTINSNGNGNAMLGVADSTAPLTGSWWYNTASIHAGVWFLSDGSVYNGGTSAGGAALGFTFNPGDVLNFALDPTTKKLWVGLNGTWSPTGSSNPATAVGGFSVSAVNTPMFPAWMCDGNGAQMTYNFGASSYAYTPPSGFGNV